MGKIMLMQNGGEDSCMVKFMGIIKCLFLYVCKFVFVYVEATFASLHKINVQYQLSKSS